MSRVEEESWSEQEQKREAWFENLREFIVEANTNTWAADGAEVEPERKGYSELEYERGDWRLRDSYSGYFRAPGVTTIYYKDKPAWTMAYAGEGMTEGNEERAKETFQFLKKALMQVSEEIPFRGPEEFQEDDFDYRFWVIDGNIEDFLAVEEIYKDDEVLFTQTVIGGLVLHRNENKKVQYPWDL